jgi:toxin ParE1/3/4
VTKAYGIRYLSTAQKDLFEIFEYILKDSPEAALDQIERFDHSVGHLASNPLLGAVPNDERLRKLGYRILVVDKYLVFYVIKERIVQIRRILHGARQYEFLL